VNPESVIYPDLISLEVSESDVLSRAADEQASRVRPADGSADRIRPEVLFIAVLCLCQCVKKISTLTNVHFAIEDLLVARHHWCC